MVMRPARRMADHQYRRPRHRPHLAPEVMLWLLIGFTSVAFLVSVCAPHPVKDHHPTSDYYCAQEGSHCAPWMAPEPAP